MEKSWFFKKSTALFFCLLLSFAIPVWADSSKVLNYREYAAYTTLDPAFSTGVTDENVMGCIYSKLITYQPGTKWEWKLDAAEEIKLIDPTHIKFRLKKGIMFSNGYGELTAEDVKFSFERIIDKKLNSPNKGDWAKLDHVEVKGKYEGVIVLNAPFQPLWMTTLPYISGNIVSKKAVTEAGGRIKMDAKACSGPYMVEKWIPKQKLVLKRNPVWSGEKTDFDKIVLYPIDDEKVAEMAYEAGDLDYTRVSISSFERYEKNPPANTKVEKRPSLYYVWLGMNFASDKLKNKDLRKAVQYAIDIPSVLQAAYSGQADASTGIIAPGLIGHRDQNLISPSADYKKAKEYLKKAGYENGVTLKLDILNKSTWVAAAQVIQATAAQAGINIEIKLNDSGSFWVLGDESAGDFWKGVDLIINRFSMAPDPYYATQWFTCDQVGVWNWERFCSEEFDSLHNAGLEEADPGVRSELYKRMQDIMEESGAYRFITHEITPLIYRDTIDAALRPDGIPLLRDFRLKK